MAALCPWRLRVGHWIRTGQRVAASRRYFAPNATEKLHELLYANDVVVLSKSTDPFSERIKSFLEEAGVEFKAIDVDVEEFGEEIVEQAARFTRQESLPNVFVGDNYIGGCMDTISAYEAGEMQQLLSKIREDENREARADEEQQKKKDFQPA
mmetsp:Transcript_7662/g.14752  ORF Transcript_7662/g.14752 Transcript_7662/m.14752 type:complete len:153 (+) Transcript_7662:3-461(+)